MNKRKLQALINRTTKASNKYFEANAALMEECIRLYGVIPGDVDCDEVIDAVLGGCGAAVGMTAEEFDAARKASIGVG